MFRNRANQLIQLWAAFSIFFGGCRRAGQYGRMGVKGWFMLCLVICIGLTRCVEPFEPEVGDYNRTLVVDGFLTNDIEPSRVILTQSIPLDGDIIEYVQEAIVIIEDDQSGSTQLLEQAPGMYETDSVLFRAEVGNSYRLSITTSDGSQFESDWELLKAAPPIGDVEVVFEDREQNDPALEPITGAQVYLDTRDATNETRYYSWKFIETYEYPLENAPRKMVTFGARPGRGNDTITAIPVDQREGVRCWRTERSTQIILATTEGFTEDIIEDMPLHFIDNSTPRLFIKYSMLVKQYAISQSYFENLRKVAELNQTTGSLFDPIPNEIFGNVRNVADADVRVLGYFGVGGVSEARIFIDRDMGDVPRDFGAAKGPSCTVESIPLDFEVLYESIESENKVLIDYARDFFDNPVGFLLTARACAYCEATGGTNVRPLFW